MKTNQNSKRKLFGGITLVICVIAVMIYTAIGASAWGVELHSLEQKIAEVESENRYLSSQIISLTSLTSLYDQSVALGYAKPKSVIYVEGQVTVAQLPQ